jgi:hypothetical protein
MDVSFMKRVDFKVRLKYIVNWSIFAKHCVVIQTYDNSNLSLEAYTHNCAVNN